MPKMKAVKTKITHWLNKAPKDSSIVIILPLSLSSVGEFAKELFYVCLYAKTFQIYPYVWLSLIGRRWDHSHSIDIEKEAQRDRANYVKPHGRIWIGIGNLTPLFWI